jgi:crotonobetaine/carnitine-CoA ligase
VLGAHPDVVECAVTPVPDEDLGEEIKAYVVLAAGAATEAGADAARLAAHVATRLAPFKVPRYWTFRASLPHTPSERVAKPKLLEDPARWREDAIDVKPRGR